MPTPTPQDLALALLRRDLDGEAFEHPWNANILFTRHPWPIWALCKALCLPLGGMDVPNWPKQPRNLKVNIGLNLSFALWDLNQRLS